MSNIVSGNPLYIDTEGVILTGPAFIKAILLKPNAAGDTATFTTWLESDAAITNGTKNAATTTVTASSGTFVSTGNFPTATVNPYQIIRVSRTSSDKNIGYWQIASNADNDTITVDKPTLPIGSKVATVEDDSNGSYDWKIWTPRPFAVIRGSGLTGDTSLNYLYYGDRGVWVPNLAMNSLSSSAVLYIYLVG